MSQWSGPRGERVARGIMKLTYRNAPLVAAGLTTAAALTLYLATIAPTVTLEAASGQMTVAADHLGVGRHPGYPLWTLVGWVFTRLLGFLEYDGSRNPALALNMMSAFFGGLACGVLSGLIVRSGLSLLCASRRADDRDVTVVVVTGAAVAAGLLLAASPTLWSQSVVVETHSLSLFLLVVFLLAVFRALEYARGRDIVWLGLAWGLGFSNSHAFVLLLPVVAVVAVALRPSWPYLVAAAGLMLLSSLSYAYIAVAPTWKTPLNAAAHVGWPEFKHVVTRGQYEKITPWRNLCCMLSDTHLLRQQLRGLVRLAGYEFTWPIGLLGMVPLLHVGAGWRTHRSWCVALAVSLVMVSFGMLAIVMPRADLQTQLITRPYWLPLHAVHALLMGYGIMILLLGRERRRHGVRHPTTI